MVYKKELQSKMDEIRDGKLTGNVLGDIVTIAIEEQKARQQLAS